MRIITESRFILRSSLATLLLIPATSWADTAIPAPEYTAVESPEIAVSEANSAAENDISGVGIDPDIMARGEMLFTRNCRQCHGSKGTAGVPLKENANLEDGSYVAGVILVGPGYMAAFADVLSDEEIAAIATYSRNSWGNDYGVVTPGDVAEMR